MGRVGGKFLDRFLDHHAAPLGGRGGFLVRQKAEVFGADRPEKKEGVGKARADDEKIKGGEGRAFRAAQRPPEHARQRENGQRYAQGNPAVEPEETAEREGNTDREKWRARRKHRPGF